MNETLSKNYQIKKKTLLIYLLFNLVCLSIFHLLPCFQINCAHLKHYNSIPYLVEFFFLDFFQASYFLLQNYCKSVNKKWQKIKNGGGVGEELKLTKQ